MKVSANGISINYDIRGKGDNLVLIHGMGDNLNMWYHQLPVFSMRYRVITYDIRGAGQTESPEGEYSVQVFAEDAYRLMKALEVENACFLGYSMGGRIALEVAVRHPEMVKAVICASSPIMLGPPPSGTPAQRPPMPDFTSEGAMEAFAEMHATSAFSPGFRDRNPDEFERYMRVKLYNTPEGLGRLMGSLGGIGSPLGAAAIKCPVLLIAGEKDSLISVEQAVKARDSIPGSKLVTLPAGHAAAVECPDDFNAAVLEFLSGID